MSTSILHYKADTRTLLFVFLYYLLAYGGFFAFNYFYATAFYTLLIPWCILTCVFCFCTAVIIHNTVHTPIFIKREHNKIMQYVLSFCYGYSVSAFVPGHNFSHHKELESPKDAMRTSKARFKWHLLNQLFFFFLITGGALKYELKWAAKMKREKPAWYRQWLLESLSVNILKIALLFINLPAAVLFIWIPHFYALWALMGVNLWQHDGCDPNHKYNHSRTFTGKIMNWFCFNNGYHGAHHDRPSLHWSLLPEYHNEMIEPHIHPNLSVKNMPLYFWKTYIYPGKRVKYDNTPYVLAPKVPDEDWTKDIFLNDRSHKFDFGAESASMEDMLDRTQVFQKERITEEEYQSLV